MIAILEKSKHLWIVWALLAIGAGSTPLQGQDNDRRSELGIRQKLVETKMAELETRLTIIAERLKEKEPQRAKRLIEVYQQSKEKLITREMAEVRRLLDQNKLQEADQKIDKVLENLESLIRLLTNEKKRELSKQDEIAMLEKMKKAIEARRDEQAKQTEETKKITHKEETINNLEAKIKQLKNLIGKQKEIIRKTENTKGQGLRKLDDVADAQFEIRKATQNLKDSLGEGNSGGQKPGDQKPGDQKPGDQKPGDQKPGDQKPGDQKPGDQKPGDQKSGGQKSGGQKSGGQKSGGQKSGKPKPPQPGQQSLEKAIEHQKRAEEKLGSGKSEEAKKEEEKALEDLEKTLREIEKEKRRIASLPPDAIKQMADEQRRNRHKVLEIAKKMKEAPKPKPDSPDGQNGAQKGQTPGQNKMEQAADAQKKAADNLDKNDPDEAQKNQKTAQKKMDEAIDEIEERLNQLREETRQEKLARLESRFREMLERQEVTSVMTIEIDDKRTSLGTLGRRDQILMLRLGTEELAIREIGQQVYDLLLEDGTSVVFPEIVQELRDDLEQAAKLLQDERTDRYTQLVQKEIETAIHDLIDALKEAQKNGKSQSGGGGGGGGGKQPLLKTSAELKILRMQQRRLNRRTQKVEQMRGEPGMNDVLNQETNKAAELQSKLIEMTEGIMEKSER